MSQVPQSGSRAPSPPTQMPQPPPRSTATCCVPKNSENRLGVEAAPSLEDTTVILTHHVINTAKAEMSASPQRLEPRTPLTYRWMQQSQNDFETDRCDLDALKAQTEKDAHSSAIYSSRSRRYCMMSSRNPRRMERRKILHISRDKRKNKTKKDRANLYRSTLIKMILKRLRGDIEEEKLEMKKSYAKYFSINNRWVSKGISELNESVSNESL